MAHTTAMTESEYKWEFKATKETPYLALMGKLWGVFCDDLGENWPYHNGTALYKAVFPGMGFPL